MKFAIIKERKFPLTQNLLRDKFVTEKVRPQKMTQDREKRHKDNGIGVGDFLEKYTWLKETPRPIRYNAVRSLVKRQRLKKSKYRSIARVRNLVSEVHKKVANDLLQELRQYHVAKVRIPEDGQEAEERE